MDAVTSSAQSIGAVFASGWATAGLLALVCAYLFRELRKSEAKLVEKMDGMQKLSDRVTAVMERLEAKAEPASHRRTPR